MIEHTVPLRRVNCQDLPREAWGTHPQATTKSSVTMTFCFVTMVDEYSSGIGSRTRTRSVSALLAAWRYMKNLIAVRSAHFLAHMLAM